ncbi:MAG: GFA family protein [Marinibacterium sp.]
MTRQGRCLCGACRFSALPDADEAGICHCSICRKSSGGINMAVNCTGVTWNADAPLRSYRSSDRAERVFCGVCGSNLFWRGLDDDPSEQSIALMAFDEPEAFAVTRQIFIDDKPATYTLANAMQTLTGAEMEVGT